MLFSFFIFAASKKAYNAIHELSNPVG